jgi:hypothetical protein
MTALFLAILLFLLAFVIHIIIWRIKQPSATAQTLIVVMCGGICGGAGALWFGGQFFPALQPMLPDTLGNWLQPVVTALSAAAVYVMTYPALEVESPTLVMIDLLAGSEPNGLSRDDLYGRLDDSFLVTPRLDDLLREGLMTEIAGRCRLTARGRKLSQIFQAWRRLLGAGIGG